MMGSDVKVVKLNKMLTKKWYKFALYLQNTVGSTFVIEFPNKEEAYHACKEINRNAAEKPTWFNMVAFSKDGFVYVIKKDKAQKVVIADG
jgi:hypothetical protein